MLLDAHAHPPVSGPGRAADTSQVEAYVEALARFDVRAVVSQLRPGPGAPQEMPEWERPHYGNEWAGELARRYPDRLIGYAYVHPRYTREALAELELRLLGQRDRFAALKMHSLVYCDDPLYDPLMEFCATHDIPVLQHTWQKIGPEGPGSGNNPNEPTPERLVTLARRHPKVKFFGGHGGGDWEWGVAAFKQVDNVWLDMGGGEAIGGFMDLALRTLGPSRIVFGTDVAGRSVPSQVSRVLACDLSDEDLERILWRNAVEVLGERLPASWREHFQRQEAGVRTFRRSDVQAPGVQAPGGAPAPAVTVAPRAGGPASSQSPAPSPQSPVTWTAGRIPRVPPPGPGGYVDANSFLGEWPSRRLNGSPPPGGPELVARRLRIMDKLGIRRAAVSLLEGVFLKDSGVANAELHALIGSRTDRFFPVYTLNPTFPAWAEHLDRCREEYGLVPGQGAIRLHPSYQGYRLDDPRLAPALTRLAALDLPVVVTLQLEDSRIHHPAIQIPDPNPEEIAAAVRRWPQVRWVLAGGRHREVHAIGTRLSAEARAWFDIARLQGPIDSIPMLREAIGIRRLLYGTNLPLIVPESPVLELADARLPAEEDAAVRHGNAREALGVE